MTVMEMNCFCEVSIEEAVEQIIRDQGIDWLLDHMSKDNEEQMKQWAMEYFEFSEE